jgi:hypothetical protein
MGQGAEQLFLESDKIDHLRDASVIVLRTHLYLGFDAMGQIIKLCLAVALAHLTHIHSKLWLCSELLVLILYVFHFPHLDFIDNIWVKFWGRVLG